MEFQSEIVLSHSVNMEFQSEIALLHSANIEFQSEIALSHNAEIEFQSEITLLHSANMEFQHNTQDLLTGKPSASPKKPFRPNENSLPATAGHHSDVQDATQRPSPQNRA